MGGCARITDAGLAHLTGIHTLDMRYCAGITDAGLAHLTGIHTLAMRGCPAINGLAHLRGTHALQGAAVSPSSPLPVRLGFPCFIK